MRLAFEKVWKIVKCLGKVIKKSGNFEIENEWQPWIDFGEILLALASTSHFLVSTISCEPVVGFLPSLHGYKIETKN